MKRAACKLAAALLALAALVLLGLFILNAVQGTQDRKMVAKMTEKMKTVCVGRLLIDVPETAEVTLTQASVDGFDITMRRESEAQFAARIALREAELKEKQNELGRKNLESARDVNVNGLAGRILIHGRERTYLIKNEQRVYSENVAIDGYAHKNGVSFDLISTGYDPKLVGNVARLIAQIEPRLQDEVPAQPGFCINGGFIRDPLTADQHESVTMFAGLPGHPDLGIVFSTLSGTKPDEGLIARDAKAEEQFPLFLRAAFSTLRKGERTLNGLPGEEVAFKAREANFAVTYSFRWEMQGKQDDVYAPVLTLELGAGRNPRAGGKPLQSSMSEVALLDLWDKISSSLRVRTASPPKQVAQAEPSLPPLGTHASAGDTCPQSGWWLCNQGGDGVGVLGGQRQFLKKGQRMPQALLLPPQTLWEKLKGIQPSYESKVATTWELVDKRSRPRTPSPVVLAPSSSTQGNAMTDQQHASSGGPAAPIGSYVKTGSPCPASGWWRCEDSQALDGTRWFAQGSFLPVATFKLPPRAFGKSAGPEVIQRRSQWQLVRYAQAPGPEPSAPDGGNNPEAPKSSA
ncbi:T6SS immunity protein Tli4 family protein [Massilia horti]|uniref:Tle cognate immunity protein 4 C-terminal domain-containing protein n=1 Tax=Massilia horti TaxID=2562153 RepID=A0A4Y9T0M6_9BURK|nr:T6SS immunity protein Tli4 family protein [Massilia horti]TFW32792.1 hypothetical protein E4O92_08945 [Massilia horti]